ncbi:CBS domain-containing protein [Actinopolyspora lacussalsi subsp. righensis]|uniref:CBS domain-containing protein n=1 Tax=Actinopolyspora righensis TaxID=995060 RepID=A0A1I6X5G4_9ACTN|nr:CBS domain-containing protein [Actinopolyspora righensis]SFT33389.1 CBS domain-containing protein [Actinopolyspora righensis]
MGTVREIMHPGADCVRTSETAADAARLMARLAVGALPICGKDDRIKGMVTDRDIVIKVVAEGRDAGTFPAGDLNQQEAVTIGADDSTDEAMRVMNEHRIRRLPVIDGERLVGMVTVADMARTMPEPRVGELVESLSEA